VIGLRNVLGGKACQARHKAIVPHINLGRGDCRKDWFRPIEPCYRRHNGWFEMRSLNLDHLRALVTVIDLGSFSAAARRLNLTQPAISAQIRDLEDRLGVRLIERAGKTARPTAAGLEMLSHAEVLLAGADRALAAMRSYRAGHAGRVHVATGPTAMHYLMPPVVLRLRETHPDIELVLTTGTTQEIAELLLANTADLGLTSLPVDDEKFSVARVRTDEMLAIFPATEGDIPDVVSPQEVAKRQLILEYQRGSQLTPSRAWLQAAGVAAKPALQFSSIADIKDAVSAGHGMAIVPAPAVTHAPPTNSLVVRPLDPPLKRTLGLIRRRDKPDDPALQAVCNAIMTLKNDAKAVAD
jgi:DNA-binding transcriptional LysR family regulator